MKNIFMAGFSLESNTFTPSKTRVKDFTILRGEEMLADLECATYLRDKGYHLVPSIHASAIPGGVMPIEDYRQIVEDILSYIPADGSIDGVWLDLHGAMHVEFINSGEAFLVSQIREKVGAEVPISIVLDMHANFSLTLSRLANIIVGYRTAPHVDYQDCLMAAAELLDQALSENVLPWTMSIKIPMTMPGENATTGVYPAKYVMEQLNELEKMDQVLRASFFTGMTWIDSTHGRSSLVVSGLGDPAPVTDAMQKLAEKIFSIRKDFKMPEPGLDPEEAVIEALADQAKLIFISDSGDNVTAGGSGDNTEMLSLLLKHQATSSLVAGLVAPKAVSACAAAGAGQTVDIRLGGEVDPANASVEGRATVKYIYNDGDGHADSALISLDGVDIIINNEREWLLSPETIAKYGANCEDYHIIVVKMGYLFPDLDAIKDRGIIAMTKGPVMLDIRQLHYENQRRPLYPLEEDFEYSTENMVY